jgi:hypothetical protein
MIQIGIKGLAKFMTAGAAAQRKVLRDYKYPDPEGQAQAACYRDARSVICKFHDENRDLAWLVAQEAMVSGGVANAPKPQIATRLKSNARAIKNYADNFASIKYEVLTDVRLTLKFASVQVTVNPDLHVREAGKEKILKLDFSDKQPENDIIKIVSQAMFEAALVEGFAVASSQILYVDVQHKIKHKGARLGATMRTNI